jgi:hypothetical protein
MVIKQQMSKNDIVVKVSGKVIGVISKWEISKTKIRPKKIFELKTKDPVSYVDGRAMYEVRKSK